MPKRKKRTPEEQWRERMAEWSAHLTFQYVHEAMLRGDKEPLRMLEESLDRRIAASKS